MTTENTKNTKEDENQTKTWIIEEEQNKDKDIKRKEGAKHQKQMQRARRRKTLKRETIVYEIIKKGDI